jgi:hypothetical protein
MIKLLNYLNNQNLLSKKLKYNRFYFLMLIYPVILIFITGFHGKKSFLQSVGLLV